MFEVSSGFPTHSSPWVCNNKVEHKREWKFFPFVTYFSHVLLFHRPIWWEWKPHDAKYKINSKRNTIKKLETIICQKVVEVLHRSGSLSLLNSISTAVFCAEGFTNRTVWCYGANEEKISIWYRAGISRTKERSACVHGKTPICLAFSDLMKVWFPVAFNWWGLKDLSPFNSYCS